MKKVINYMLKHRELLLALVKRDLKGRYIGSSLGFFWSVLNPLLMIAIFVIIFSGLFGAETKFGGRTVGFAIFLCCGLLPWNFIFESFLASCNTIVGNSTLIKKVMFPVWVLPIQTILSSFVHFLIAFGLFMIFAVIFAGWPGVMILWIPVIFVFQVFFVIGPAYAFAALNVFLRDTAQILNAILLFLFWGTPIVYPEYIILGEDKPAGVIKSALGIWFKINPVHHIVKMYRNIIIGQERIVENIIIDGKEVEVFKIVRFPPSPLSLGYLFLISVVMIIIGYFIFSRTKSSFPDEV